MVVATKFDDSRKARFLLVCSQLKPMREAKSLSLSLAARYAKRQVSQLHGIETPQPTEANITLLKDYLEAIECDGKEITKLLKFINEGK